jgi:two-component system chemotaxis response regulator CheB
VRALSDLVARLPADLPATVLIVLHSSPTHESLLHQILDKAGPLRATAAVDGEKLQPGHIYVSVSDLHLMVEDHHIRLTRGPKECRARPSVDVLFRSAAYTFGPQVIGIVLTGALDDGTAGLWAIKDRGGIAIVQSPHEALYPSMPQSALRHVAVDYTLPIRDMGALLDKLVKEEIDMKQLRPVRRSMEIENRIAREGKAFEIGAMELGEPTHYTCPECSGTLAQVEDGSSLSRFRCHTGHAYTLKTLLADLDQSLDHTLWNVLRGIEERLLVLRELERHAQIAGDQNAEADYHQQISIATRWHGELRGLLLEGSAQGPYKLAAAE